MMTDIFLRRVLSLEAAYRLIVIEDEKIPLAEAPKLLNEYFLGTLAVMVLAVAVLLLVIYLIWCRCYRKRIRELDSEGEISCGWSLKRLKEQVAELEAQKVEENFGDV